MESKNGPIRTLHRNFLLPFVSIPDTELLTPKPVPPKRIKTRSVAKQPNNDSETESSSEDDNDGIYVQPYTTNTKRQDANLDLDPRSRTSISNMSNIPSASFQINQENRLPEIAETVTNTIRQDASLNPAQGTEDFSQSVRSTINNVSESQQSNVSIATSGNFTDQVIIPADTQEEPAVLPSRPVRNKRAPDRYGEWMFP